MTTHHPCVPQRPEHAIERANAGGHERGLSANTISDVKRLQQQRTTDVDRRVPRPDRSAAVAR